MPYTSRTRSLDRLVISKGCLAYLWVNGSQSSFLVVDDHNPENDLEQLLTLYRSLKLDKDWDIQFSPVNTSEPDMTFVDGNKTISGTGSKLIGPIKIPDGEQKLNFNVPFENGYYPPPSIQSFMLVEPIGSECTENSGNPTLPANLQEIAYSMRIAIVDGGSYIFHSNGCVAMLWVVADQIDDRDWTVQIEQLNQPKPTIEPTENAPITIKFLKWENIIPADTGKPNSKPIQKEVDDMWAVNLPAILTLKLENTGKQDSQNIRLQISIRDSHTNNRVILTTTDPIRIGAIATRDVLISLKFQEQWDYYGDVDLLINLLNDAEEINADEPRLIHQITLVDPYPERYVAKVFDTCKEAEDYLTDQGFEYTILDIASGWHKSLTGKDIRSRRDGQFKPASSFRMQGGTALIGLRCYVLIQGSPILGEPNPFRAFAFRWAPLYDYVRSWHRQF